jgi:hypothetical protein
VLANSDVGAMVLNRAPSGGTYNRLLGADANFRFFRNLNVNGFVAKTLSPESVVGSDGSDLMHRIGTSYRADALDIRAAHTTTGQRFNDELGYIPRVGINRTDFYLGVHIRPKATSRWLRETFPHYQLSSLTRNGRGGGFDSRFVDYHLPFTLQNGTLIEAGMNANVEVLTSAFTLNKGRNIAIDPGRYEYNEWFLLVSGNRSAPVSLSGRYGIGDFYDGHKRSYQLGPQVRLHARFNTGLTWTRNVISLRRGTYTTDLLTGRVNYSFSTRMFLNALLQYNTDAQQWSSNVRFNVIHRPLSDFFLVYNDRRDSTSGALIDRAVVAKITYMMAF